MKSPTRDKLLEVKNLQVSFLGGIKTITALSGISFSIGERETLALVGETGCGKSVAAHAIMRLLPPESGVKGTVELRGGRNLLGLSEKEMTEIRGGKEIGIIFQNPPPLPSIPCIP